MMLELFGAPWAITETGLKTIINVASRDTFFQDIRKQALEARDGAPLTNSKSGIRMHGSVAVIRVQGPLVRHADMFSEISGATSYAALRKDLQVALEDQAVDSILFNIDSPGGEVNGCFEMADAIYAARSIKPVRAYVGGMGASAAYALACACEDITCAATAELGSIGVRAGFLDDSTHLDMHGFKSWTFVSSQSPHKAFDVNVEDDRARLQVVLDDLAAVFVGHVARGRDVGADAVLSDFGKGDVMVGARAVAADLADQLGDFESLIAEMNGFSNQPEAMRLAAKGNRMTIKASTATPAVAASVSNSSCDGCGAKMSGNSYCQGCMDDDDDEDEEDDEDAKALGVDKSMSRVDRRKCIAALVDFSKHMVEATGTKNVAEAKGKITAALADSAKLADMQVGLQKAEAEGRKRDLRHALELGIKDKKLALGAIQKTLPLVLRGEQKAAWAVAMGKLEVVSAQTVIDAACSVDVTADDLDAIKEFAKSSTPFAAEASKEPPRDPVAESADLDETMKQISRVAEATRKSLDRGLRSPTTK